MQTLDTSGAPAVLQPKKVIEGFRLSTQQAHLWRLSSDGGRSPYHVVGVVRIEGEIDEERLWAALDEVVERHEILRTSFELIPGMEEPLQVIGRGGLRRHPVRDLFGLDPSDWDATLERLLSDALSLPAGTEEGPSVTLVRLAEDQRALLLDLPPLCADSLSLAFLTAEIARCHAGVSGETEPGMQYADYAAWQQDLLQSDEAREEAAKWRQPGPLAVAGAAIPWVHEGSSGAFTLETTAVPVTGGFAGSGEPSFWLACWSALLARLSGERRIALAVACDARTYEELQGAIGLFTRYLPVVCEVADADGFERVQAAWSEALEDAAARQDSFAWEHFQAPGEDHPPSPAFAFAMEEVVRPLAGGAATFTLAARSACTERFLVELLCRRREGRIIPVLRYDASRLPAQEAARLAACLGALAEGAVARPRAPLGELEILPAPELQRLAQWNRTQAELHGAGLLHEPFERQTARTPYRIAVRLGQESLTYAELDERAGRLARRLRGLGVGPEVRVAICVERSLEMVVGLLGILKAGGAYVPLDPDHPAERRAAILAETAPPVVLTQRRLAEQLPRAGARRLCLDEPLGESPEAGPGPDLANEVAPDHLAYVLYTSGSTGRPKGVMVSHRAISNRLLWMLRDYPLNENDRVLQKTPYGFDASIWEIFCPLYTGAELVLARPGGHQDMPYIAAVTAAEGITTLQLVPSLLHAFLEEPGVAGCTGLRRVFCGGEALATDLASRFSALLGADLHNLYGPTEAAIDATCWPCREGIGRHGVPIGRPIANVRVHLLDASLRPVPVGVAGELCIAGAGLARGYLRRPATTAERFVPNPFDGEPGGRLYRTGDLARHLEGGEIEYLGRIDRQVKIRGVRIEPREIEVLLREHAAVREAVVAAREDSVGTRLVAWVVPREPGAGLDAQALRNFLRERLPEVMVPAAFVPIPSVPLTSNGKLDLAALPDHAAVSLVAPRSETEAVLAALWSEVLGVAEVGAHDNFFELGGHSLSATQLISRIRKGLRIDLAVHQLFDAPTVAGLARQVEAAMRGQRGGPPPIRPAPQQEEMPLSFAQQRLWFFERMRPGTPVFNIIVAFRLRGQLDAGALARAFTAVVRRHEILRTTFPDRRGLPIQVIGRPWPFTLLCVDLSGLPEREREEEMRRRVAEEGYRPFDLARGPLLRAVLLRLGEREHVLPLTVHHIVSDAWSSGILSRELVALYRAFVSDGEPALPELPIQYADFAVWQQAWISGEALAAQTEYWKRQLEDAPELLTLPSDRPRPERLTHRGRTLPVSFPADLAEALAAMGRRYGATLFMTLLAAFQILLRHYTGRDDIVVGTDVANRNRVEIEGLIGFFINQLVLRTDLSGDPDFIELLARVRATTLGAYAHQDTPFEHLVDALRVPRTLTHAPLFQVKLFVENTPAGDLSFPGLDITQVDFETGVAKLDLTLAFWQRSKGPLTGWINYNTDLFDGSRIERLVGHYRTILETVVARPEARLSDLDAVVSALERKEKEMERRELKELGFKKFKAVAPKAVVLPEEEVVEKTFLAAGQELPLVIQPRIQDVDLADWAEVHREELERDLLRYGAILFRGFGIDSPESLERFASTLCKDLFNENGEHPRESVTGNVYTPVFFPPDQQLLWHNENSFNWSWPRKIFFCCARPADAGGETPLVDSRRVYREVPAEIREQFESKGVLYQRNYAEGLGLPWQTVFQASSREEVEHRCRESRVELDWRDGDRLRTRALRPGVVKHPVTGEPTWFNQAQHWHISCLDPETGKALRSLYAEEDLPRSCYYGDGSPISDEEMGVILEVYRRLEVTFPWQRGDVLMVDNVLTAHGRNPFSGPRKILVAMGQMTSYG